MTKRVVIVGLVAAVVAAVAAYLLKPETGVPDDAPTQDAMARSLGTDVMLHLTRGHVPGRSGEVMMVAKPHHFLIAEWRLESLLSGQPNLLSTHPGPWSYIARVPIVLYGDGVPADRVVESSVDISQLAPSYARLIGFAMDRTSPPLPGFDQPDPTPPKVIVTVVMDGGGWNTLQLHPNAWPNIERLMKRGTTFTNATIGSAPSITGALHATFGTGVYPVVHGLPGNQLRAPDGSNVDSWLQNADPRYLRAPSLADLWDVSNHNKAVIATVSYEGWHLGMIGQGADYEGGDKDLAAVWDPEKNEWWINEDFYSLPPYLAHPDLGTLLRYESLLDARDGVKDGTWFGHTRAEIQALNDEGEALVRPATPAFVRYTGDAVDEVLRQEPFGEDDVTDFFWVEMKMPDYTGHQWNVESAEEEDVLAETDAQIGRLVNELDRKVGRGNYILAVSADHGQQPFPELKDGWRVSATELHEDVEARFGRIVEKVTTTDLYIDLDEVDRLDVDLEDVARWLATYTVGDNIPDDAPGQDFVPEARRDDLIFAGVFTSDYLAGLTDEEIQSLGPSEYAEGDLTSPLGDQEVKGSIP